MTTAPVFMAAPAAALADCRNLIVGLGIYPLPTDAFTIPLSYTGSNPPTHYGTNDATMPVASRNLLELAIAGELPESIDWSDFDLVDEAGALAVATTIYMYDGSWQNGLANHDPELKRIITLP